MCAVSAVWGVGSNSRKLLKTNCHCSYENQKNFGFTGIEDIAAIRAIKVYTLKTNLVLSQPGNDVVTRTYPT
jgi:hypothetical protein